MDQLKKVLALLLCLALVFSVLPTALAPGEEVVAAYEYCNLHGLWKAE